MSFLFPLGLALAAFVLGPIIAHSLRRGSSRELELPTARFIEENQTSSRKRRAISDRSLLLLRILLLLALSLLAASPLAHLGSLSLSRPRGGSLAVALVIDDSASMRVKTTRGVRFDTAVRAALDLVSSTTEGDSVSIILAGKPARQYLAATRNMDAVRRALSELQPSERETDLEGALLLAQTSLSGLLQEDKQVIVLSDLATSESVPLGPSDLSVQYSLPELREPFENCGIVQASRSSSRASVDVRCTSALARGKRTVSLFLQDAGSAGPKPVGSPLAKARLAETEVLHLTLPNDKLGPDTRVVAVLESSNRDQIPSDDSLELQVGDSELLIGIRADQEAARVETSERTIVELGLESLEAKVHQSVLSSLPEAADELSRYAALIVDDPQGFSPETQNALEGWVQKGGVLFALLGPRAATAPLSTGFWPISRGYFQFRSSSAPLNVIEDDARTELGRGYDSLAASRHATFEPIPDAKILLRFEDESPLLLERPLGRGLVVLAALPASLSVSDFTLRPGFLGILDHVVAQARARATTGPALPGAEWNIPAGHRVVLGSERPANGSRFVPEESGRVEIRGPDQTMARVVGRHPSEVVRQPREPEGGLGAEVSENNGLSPISRPIALLVLALGVVELLVRRERGRRGAPSAMSAA